MSLKKKINIKPIHLMIGGKQKKQKKEKKQHKKTIESLFKPNKVKKELLEKIKKHQLDKKKKLFQNANQKDNNNTTNTSEFSDSFQDSLLYLNKFSENLQKKETNPLNKTQKIKESNNLTPDPPYGILKGGKKQLYSNYRKTLKQKKNTDPVPPSIKLKFNLDNIPQPPKPSFIKERQQKLNTLKNNMLAEKPIPKTKPKIFRKTKTLKRKLVLGKNKMKGKISVLIKNRKTRRKIKNDTLKLKKKSLQEIKQYLRIHNLIKIGTNAPEQVLRETYENAFLSGNIYNKNSDNLLHNYMNNE